MNQKVYELEYRLAKLRGFTEEEARDYAKREANKPGGSLARNSVTGEVYTAEQVATMKFYGGN